MTDDRGNFHDDIASYQHRRTIVNGLKIAGALAALAIISGAAIVASELAWALKEVAQL